MSPDEFALALRTLGAPLFLDDAGIATPLGVEYAATTEDGTRVRVTQLAAALADGLRDRDAFVRTLGRHRYHGAGIAGRSLYVVELPPRGVPLATRLAREGTIAPTALAPLAAATADVLAAYHRDLGAHGLITPATLFIDESGGVTLRWGGIAPALRAAGADLVAIETQLQASSYLAPELADGAVFDARSDVFAFGATFYTAATGRPPFGGRTTAGVMASVLTDDADTQASPAHRLTAAVLRAIEHEPADRWNDAEQLRDAIAGQADPVPAPVNRRGCLGGVATFVMFALVLWRLTQ